MRGRVALAAMLAVLTVAGWSVPGSADPRTPPRVPPGFTITPYAEIEGLATSLAFGPDTRSGARDEATRLYATDYSGGRVMAVDSVGGEAGTVSVFASGLRSPLGIVAAADGSVFVSDSEPARPGPFGLRPYGRVWRFVDRDADGAADKKILVLEDLPNGRHNTNGLAFGPDGMLYVTNGNSTDDGVEGGEPEAVPWSGAVTRVDPRARKVSVAGLGRRALVAHGWRNVYDLAFSPVDPTRLFVPMNGVDDAREGSSGNPGEQDLENSDDLLYATDIDDRAIDDFGFPSCLYNFERQGNLRPYDNPNPAVRELFGRCAKSSVPRPAATFGTHVSADGLAFQVTDAWGKDYRNDLFVAEWGSLWGDEVKGHDVVHIELNARGDRVVEQSRFLIGAFPLDVTFDAAGSMYVADFAGPIYKITKRV